MSESEKQFTRSGKTKLDKSKLRNVKNQRRKKKVVRARWWERIADAVGTLIAKVLAEVVRNIFGL